MLGGQDIRKTAFDQAHEAERLLYPLVAVPLNPADQAAPELVVGAFGEVVVVEEFVLRFVAISRIFPRVN